MAWTRVGFPVSSSSDPPVGSLSLAFPPPIHKGDLVLIGVATLPNGGGYAVSDLAPPGTFAWVPSASQVFAGGIGVASLYYAIAAHAVPGLTAQVDLNPAGLASWIVMGCVYRNPGAIFTDQTSAGTGSGATLTGSLLTPASADELAVAFGTVLTNGGPTGADAPLQAQLVLSGMVMGSPTWADSLSTAAPFTPTMHAILPGDWVLLAATFGATSPPPHGHPGPFLGSGLEPFPMRRRAERGDYSSRTQIRRIQLLDLFKQEDEHG